MTVELKIKSKHLGEEARIIRFEERKLRKQIEWKRKQHETSGSNDPFVVFNEPTWIKWESIKSHRRNEVRNENRATFLARAFLEGKEYSTVERKRNPSKEYIFRIKVVPRIAKMATKYGMNGLVTEKDILDWATI